MFAQPEEPTPEQSPNLLNQLFPDEQPQGPLAQFRLKNRNVEPTDPNQMHQRNLLRKSRFSSFGEDPSIALHTASFDPSFMSFNKDWKFHNDTRKYNYYEE